MGALTNRPLKIWLIGTLCLVACMVAVGGLTRLTFSGLSIPEWKPLTGILPPLSAQKWHAAFEHYKKVPQFELLNRDMDLQSFKIIYLWEWFHRFLGRFTALVFLLPFLFFSQTQRLSKRLQIYLVFVLFLGLLQGFLGWYMVKSGLFSHVEHVSALRLAFHLTMAFLIYALLVGALLSLSIPDETIPSKISRGLKIFMIVFLVLTSIQIFFGALVAGTHAGLVYKTFPLMDGHWIPEGLLKDHPWYKNSLTNIIFIQFQHRILGMILFFSCLGLTLCLKKERNVRTAAHFLLASTFLQVLLGIMALLKGGLILYFLHQMSALVFFTCTLWCAYMVFYKSYTHASVTQHREVGEILCERK